MNTQIFALNSTSDKIDTPPTLQENLTDITNTADSIMINVDQNSFKNSTSKQNIPNQRSGYQLTNKQGTITGELTLDDPLDYYLFSKNTTFKQSIVFNPNDPSYTITLGLADYTTGEITLSNVTLDAGNHYVVTFSPLSPNQDYAWVIQSQNTPSGASYSFTYNSNYTVTSNPNMDVFYMTPNGDEYSVYKQKLYLNGTLVNLDYRYDIGFQNPYGYQERHIWVENPNIQPFFVGEVEWYASRVRRHYDHVIVLKLMPGGTFTHRFYQNPPYFNWGYHDAAGIKTPRSFNLDDFKYSRNHFLVYDIEQGQTIQFVSSLSANWNRDVGDLHDFRLLREK